MNRLRDTWKADSVPRATLFLSASDHVRAFMQSHLMGPQARKWVKTHDVGNGTGSIAHS